jgi:pSer/pThr/pTyr-binding forkhead associated (FHA) protein
MTWAARVVLKRPDEPESREVTLMGSTLFGRGAPANYVIDHPYLSLQHVWVRVQSDGGVLVEDVRSENGSFLEGKQLRGVQRFAPGQALVFGRVTLRLVETFEVDDNQ